MNLITKITGTKRATILWALVLLLTSSTLGLFIVKSHKVKEYKAPYVSENEAAIKQYFADMEENDKKCADIKVIGKDMLAVSKTLKPFGRWFNNCLSETDKWVALLNAKQLTSEQMAFVNKSLCSEEDKSLDPKQDKWCLDIPFECPICAIGSYEQMYGKEKGFQEYMKAKSLEIERVEMRKEFIKKYIFKQKSKFTWSAN